jgi:hypothetical protein
MSDTTSPDPNDDRPSGRFVLRIDPDLHAFLREAAGTAGVSLNEFCSRSLLLPPSDLPEGILEALRRAIRLLGEDLLAAVAFGSWARGELVEESDIDLLLVLRSEVDLRRSLYRAWDRSPLTWSGHSIEPHFVHLPDEGARITGFWAEVVLDGIVLFDRDLALSRRLAEFRRRIASGALVRRWTGGHPYWVEVA